MRITAKNIFSPRNYPLHKTLVKSTVCVIALIASGQTIAVAPPDVTTNVVIYSLSGNGGGNQAGNMGGRAGADALCLTSGSRPLTGATVNTQYRAFLSVSATDEIRDMPANYNVPTTLPVVGNSAGSTTAIVSNWAALLNGTILSATMQGATGATNVGYWTGSDGVGAMSVTQGTCTGWTSNSAIVTGDVGTHNSTASPNWLNGGWAGFTCNLTYNLLCVAFTPPSIAPVSASINLSDSVKASTFSKEITVK